MKCEILTIFPEIFQAYLSEGMLRRALLRGLVDIKVHNLRDYHRDKHRTVDDCPYGGGSGMVMKTEPFFTAVDALNPDPAERRVILLSPAGEKINPDLGAET